MYQNGRGVARTDRGAALVRLAAARGDTRAQKALQIAQQPTQKAAVQKEPAAQKNTLAQSNKAAEQCRVELQREALPRQHRRERAGRSLPTTLAEDSHANA
jgi:hypothetical protein